MNANEGQPNAAPPTPPAQETKEHPPRNLRMYFEETFAAMSDVELPAWRVNEQRITREWSRVSDSEQSVSMEGIRRWLGTKPTGFKPKTVYGEGGKNRWFVMPDGVVAFSRMHARSAEALQKAESMGFAVR